MILKWLRAKHVITATFAMHNFLFIAILFWTADLTNTVGAPLNQCKQVISWQIDAQNLWAAEYDTWN